MVPLEEVAGKLKFVDPNCSLIKEARMMGISFGDKVGEEEEAVPVDAALPKAVKATEEVPAKEKGKKKEKKVKKAKKEKKEKDKK